MFSLIYTVPSCWPIHLTVIWSCHTVSLLQLRVVAKFLCNERQIPQLWEQWVLLSNHWFIIFLVYRVFVWWDIPLLWEKTSTEWWDKHLVEEHNFCLVRKFLQIGLQSIVKCLEELGLYINMWFSMWCKGCEAKWVVPFKLLIQSFLWLHSAQYQKVHVMEYFFV